MNEKFYSQEVNPFQNGTKTLAITPNFVYGDEYGFNKIFDKKESKIKLDLNNFKNGKGENATHHYYNLTIDQFLNLRISLLNGSIYRKKISLYADYGVFGTIKSGEHEGEYKYRSLSVEYNEKLNNPFKITFVEGYYKINGDKRENTTSTTDNVMLTEEKFISIIEDIYAVYLVEIKDVSLNIREESKKKFKEQLEDAKKKAERKKAETSNTVNKPQEPATVKKETVQTNNNQPEIHLVEGIFVSDFQALENAEVALFRIGENDYQVYFQTVPEQLRTAAEIRSSVKINLYEYNGNLIFHSLY